ncbi:hypothetical protein C1645_607085 [Glomus cerebriforme]|uniref:Uncharacterized protein n=1 Tax=Glomus cerebriforme TaxID=658196 RepID=A0A397TFU4_9GLOM|nr:hypothetical protein C1645_607085 [Glomus cerebriforme]
MLIMDSGIPSRERTSNDIRQYMRQDIHPYRADRGNQKMYDDEPRRKHNVTKRHDRVQYSNSDPKDGTIDNWLRNCQIQDVDGSHTIEQQIINPVNDDEQGNNCAQSPSRRSHSYTELRLNSGDSLISRDGYNQSPSRNCNKVGDTYNKLSPQNNKITGNLSLTPPNNKSSFRDRGIQRESHTIYTKNLREHSQSEILNSSNVNHGIQLENCAMDSDPFVDGIIDNKGGNKIIDNEIVESMHKRPRIDYINDSMKTVFAPETSRNGLNEFVDHSSTTLLNVNEDNIVQLETETGINSNQLQNDHNGQLQRKEMGTRTIAIGQPTIDDLLKSGAINLSSLGTDNNVNVATNVNAQLQQLKKKSANDNRLSLSLVDVLNQELRLKFNKSRIIRRTKSTSIRNQFGYSLSCFNKLDYGMWTVTRKFNEKFMDILMVHGERFESLLFTLKYSILVLIILSDSLR